MKKNKFLTTVFTVLSCFACVLTCSGGEGQKPQKAVAQEVCGGSSLEEITKPYLGVYECKSLYFGGEDKKDIFQYFRIELKSNGELLLSYKLKRGQVNQIPLNYEYDFAEKTLWVRGQWGVLKADKKFPVKKGEINVAMNIFGKLAVLKLARP